MSNTTLSITNTDKTRKMIFAALFASLTCVSTMIIKIPTPTNGYIHPGDGFVLLSSLLLGPVWGTLAAGIGSALSDLIGGYFIYVPATFIIKSLTALVGYYVFHFLLRLIGTNTNAPQLILGGIAGEFIMVAGYFLFEIFMLSVLNDTSLEASTIASAASIIPNIIQAMFGVIISTILYPILFKKLPI